MKKCLTCKNYILACKLPQGGIIKEVAHMCTKGIKGVEPNACCSLWEARTNGLVGEPNLKVSEHLKCKHLKLTFHTPLKYKNEEIAFKICKLHHNDCVDSLCSVVSCKDFVNKYKEWENEGRKGTDGDKR